MSYRDTRPWWAMFVPRFVGRIGLADLFSLMTACLGGIAILVALSDSGLAARLLLLAAITDALDGAVARVRGGSDAGELFDSLSDVVAFCVAPAVFVLGVVHHTMGLPLTVVSVELGVAVAAMLAYMSMGITRLALYTAYDTSRRETLGMQTTLAATLLTTGYLAGVLGATALIVGLVVCAYWMSSQVPYPDLRLHHALAMGAVQFGAVTAAAPYHQWFAAGVFAAAVVYAALSPRYYPRAEIQSVSDTAGATGTVDV